MTVFGYSERIEEWVILSVSDAAIQVLSSNKHKGRLLLDEDRLKKITLDERMENEVLKWYNAGT